MTTHYISKEGLEKIKQELEEREGSMRSQIANRIADAKELGDLSENAEYAEAREKQSMNEGRINELKETINSAVVIDSEVKSSIVAVGATVTAGCEDGEKTFTIVGVDEAEPTAGFISHESPLGAAFLGKKVGEEVEVETPKGKLRWKILKVK